MGNKWQIYKNDIKQHSKLFIIAIIIILGLIFKFIYQDLRQLQNKSASTGDFVDPVEMYEKQQAELQVVNHQDSVQ